MKKHSLFAALALFAITAVPHASFAGQQNVVLSVPDMNCSACPITVRKALERVAGVKNVKATLEPPEAMVTFDDAKTSIEKLTETTRNAGYPSSVKSGK